jgi:hypothetical protein
VGAERVGLILSGQDRRIAWVVRHEKAASAAFFMFIEKPWSDPSVETGVRPRFLDGWGGRCVAQAGHA